MADDPSVPEFTLPDWGTDGAPPAPTVPDEQEEHASSIEISVERPVLVTSGVLPPAWNVHTVHGLVTAHGDSDRGHDTEAYESATADAISALGERALAMGANAVTDVAITVGGRKSQVVVTVWGTAVSFSR